ncbi:methionine adenosyltransferase, partial [Phenylobacterium sp.]|uniref:methionine adenosyltransferase n=1 Tax=Phenylobacterium sp. TaxID=1871053 RepID=UPI002E367DE5
MSRSNYIFTSESVSEGHPDKVADRISDTVVDAFLSVEPEARVACETLVTTNRIVLAGEVRAGRPGGSKAENKALTKDIVKSLEPKVRQAIKDIGYEQKGFHWAKAKYACYLHPQSAHIAQGVDASDKKDEGAGDQGIMFGYACDETPSLMPATLQYSHDILRRLAEVRHSGECHVLEPDAKSQVTLRYEDGQPVEVLQIVVSTQHKKRIGLHSATPKRIEGVIRPYVEAVFPAGLITKKTKWHVNPTGRFEIGGPDGDAGLTGRKIIVDTYGGAAPHGGGAFSGKDPTKVDRSACYMARYVAKNVVAAGLAERCMVQLAYAIGVAEPVSVLIDTFSTGTIPDDKISDLVRAHFKLTPRGIIESLDLRRPIYKKTAAFGHFGRTEPEFTWEK